MKYPEFILTDEEKVNFEYGYAAFIAGRAIHANPWRGMIDDRVIPRRWWAFSAWMAGYGTAQVDDAAKNEPSRNIEVRNRYMLARMK